MSAEEKKLEKMIAQAGNRFTPGNRFLMGLTLASIYHKHGRKAFAQNCLALGMDGDGIAAMLVDLHKPSNAPVRAGYTPEVE